MGVAEIAVNARLKNMGAMDAFFVIFKKGFRHGHLF